MTCNFVVCDSRPFEPGIFFVKIFGELKYFTYLCSNKTQKAMKAKKQTPIREWDVNIEFNIYDFRVKARTASEAKKKAYAKVRAKGYSAVNHKSTFVDKI